MAQRRTNSCHLIFLAVFAACDGDEVGALKSESRRGEVIADTDKGGGVHLANTPGGFYMGRLYQGETFDRHTFSYRRQQGDVYHGEKGSQYGWGQAWGSVRACLWIGPSNGENVIWPLNKYLSKQMSSAPNRCPQSKIDFLADESGGEIGSHFNCDPKGPATFGTLKKLDRDADFYHNIQWDDKYQGGMLVNKKATLPKGTDVWYRYTTRDGNRIIVYANKDLGWGFMNTGVLDRSMTGVYNKYPGGPALDCKTDMPVMPPQMPPAAMGVPLHRLSHRGYQVYFYTTNPIEADQAERIHGYTREGVCCKVLPGETPGTDPFQRLYHPTYGVRFYTRNIIEAYQAVYTHGYRHERNEGAVYAQPVPGAVPLFRLVRNGKRFYTVSDPERAEAIRIGYQQESNEGYVLP